MLEQMQRDTREMRLHREVIEAWRRTFLAQRLTERVPSLKPKPWPHVSKL
jgi:hypothetical protein